MSSSTVVSEVLCFVSVQSDKLDRANIESVLLDFYTQDELVSGKNLLLAECHKDGLSDAINTESKKIRKKPNLQQKVVKDLLDVWDVVDRERGGQLPFIFVAANINRLPSVNAEKFSLQFLISSILKLQHQAEEQINAIGFLSTSVSKIHRRLDTSTVSAPSPSFYSPSTPRRRCPPTPVESGDCSISNYNVNSNVRRSVVIGNKRKSLDAEVPPFIPCKQQISCSSVFGDKVFADSLSNSHTLLAEGQVTNTPVTETLATDTLVKTSPVIETPVTETPVTDTSVTDTPLTIIPV